MSDAIIVAMIGAVGAIVGGVAPVVVKYLLENRNERRASEDLRSNEERSGFWWEAVAALPAAIVAIGSSLVCKQLGYSERVVCIVWFATFFVAMLISTSLLRVKM